MKSKSLVLMVLSLGFGLVAAIGISQVMGRNNPEAPKIQTRTVIVAADDLEYKTLLTPENVKEEQWPVDIIPANAVTSMDQITDMATQTFVAKQMPISTSNIVHKKQLNVIHIPRGFQVIHIKVSAEDTGNGLLQPNDRVNLIGHIKNRPARAFLKGLRVFSVNAQLTATSGNREEQGSRSDAIVGILANERQAEMIMQVLKEGKLKLSMLGDSIDFDEYGIVDEEGVRGLGLLDNIVEESQSKVPPIAVISEPIEPKTKKMQTMRVWSGVNMELVTFRDGIAEIGPTFVPGPSITPRPAASLPDAPVNSNPWERSSEFGDDDADFDEDKYPS